MILADKIRATEILSHQLVIVQSQDLSLGTNSRILGYILF